MVGWVAGSNENRTISTEVKVVIKVGVELGNFKGIFLGEGPPKKEKLYFK